MVRIRVFSVMLRAVVTALVGRPVRMTGMRPFQRSSTPLRIDSRNFPTRLFRSWSGRRVSSSQPSRINTALVSLCSRAYSSPAGVDVKNLFCNLCNGFVVSLLSEIAKRNPDGLVSQLDQFHREPNRKRRFARTGTALNHQKFLQAFLLKPVPRGRQ